MERANKLEKAAAEKAEKAAKGGDQPAAGAAGGGEGEDEGWDGEAVADRVGEIIEELKPTMAGSDKRKVLVEELLALLQVTAC